MAKNEGAIKIRGSVDDLTFYRMDGNRYIRSKGGIDRERIMNEPNFVRTRENMSEFKESAVSGKMLRVAVGPISFRAKDSRMTSRLTGVMSKVKNWDLTSTRGNRLVSNGIQSAEGKLELKNFNFNLYSSYSHVINAPYELNIDTGVIRITGLVPANQVFFPQGATHVSFQGAAMDIDFVTGASVIAFSEVVALPLDMTKEDVVLTPADVPKGLGVQFFLLSVTFSQETNGLLYPLKNEEFNVLQIIDVV